MRDSISIIFAAIVGTLLIVILPLYSILDRQDSMSYNVVLTATTNFVDNVRNNGFIDRDSYNQYMAKLATTSNTYKVNLEVYKKVLIKDTDENGNIINDSYIEEKELYNIQDILQVIDAGNIDGANESNIKNSAYLLNENDEIYIRIHNTNITTGSMLYSLLSDTTNSEVINISYGGVINNVNWELYDKINAEEAKAPEVLISVPINSLGSTNIQKVENDEDSYSGNLACPSIDSEDLLGSTTIEELCGDLNDKEQYVYLYDLTDIKNKTITVAVELRRFAKIDIGKTGESYVDISKLETEWNEAVGQYILDTYVESDGFWSERSIKLRENGDYYIFEITFSDVKMSQIDYISSKAKIVIRPGLGVDEYGTASLIAESVEIELTDTDAINNVTISQPINWKKLLKTISLSESIILNNTVYAKQEIAFLISYTGIKNEQEEDDHDRDERILQAIKDYLEIHQKDAAKSNIAYYTATDLKLAHDIDISTSTAGHVLVKFSYNSANTSTENYLSLPNGWIETNIENTYDYETEGLEAPISSVGAQSVRYEVLLDDTDPLPPTLMIEATSGKSGWYTSNVTLNLIDSKNDQIKRSGKTQIGGSGVYRNTLSVEGAANVAEQEINTYVISANGTSYAIGKAYDYVGNVVTTESLEIKIDTELPTEPKIEVSGTQGKNGWYKSDVEIKIIPGTDSISGVDKTTYRIIGANAVDETEGTSYKITKSGQSTIIATTYDKAGNRTEKSVVINMDKSVPPDALITVIDGEKNHINNDWYHTDVTLEITVAADASVSGLGVSSYKVTGDSEVKLTSFEGNKKEITFNSNGTHNLTVYTYTQAGNYKETKYTVKIDKNAPKAPTINVNGTPGENGWHTSNVEVTVTTNDDVGPSGENMMTYTITKNGVTTIETEIKNNGKINFNEEGEYTLKVYSRDNALNKIEITKEIKIDKTNPTPADFIIYGTKGKEEWYVSDVYLDHKGSQDLVSGVQSVTLSTNELTKNTTGTKVTLTTKDNAGHSVTKEITIKIDKSYPNAPVINLSEEPTGSGLVGTMLYNKDITITITPGIDNFIEGIDNLEKNTLEVTTKNGSVVLLAETETNTFKITQEGIITVTARAYDKAGNVTTASQVIWINKSKPATPKIASINGTEIGDTLNKEVIGNSKTLSLGVDNLTEGNDVNITLINQETSEEIKEYKVAPGNGLINIELNKKGTYSIKIIQTNMYGTISEESAGHYLYTYK